MSDPSAPRVQLVLGKGGVGRTTVSRALALAYAEQRPVRLIHAANVVTPGGAPPDDLAGRVRVEHADPRALLDARVQQASHLGPFAGRITGHPLYEALVDIMPGVREAALLHHALTPRSAGIGSGARRTTPTIVDAPATGHALHLLRAPAQLADVLAGRARTAMLDLAERLQDPAEVQIVLVTVPEELPMTETLELLQQAPKLGLSVRGVVLNRLPPAVPAAREPSWPDRSERVTVPQALTLLQAWRKDADVWESRLDLALDATSARPTAPIEVAVLARPGARGPRPAQIGLPYMVDSPDLVDALVPYFRGWVP